MSNKQIKVKVSKNGRIITEFKLSENDKHNNTFFPSMVTKYYNHNLPNVFYCIKKYYQKASYDQLNYRHKSLRNRNKTA